jgi:hypothetical protein
MNGAGAESRSAFRILGSGSGSAREVVVIFVRTNPIPDVYVTILDIYRTIAKVDVDGSGTTSVTTLTGILQFVIVELRRVRIPQKNRKSLSGQVNDRFRQLFQTIPVAFGSAVSPLPTPRGAH